jgi:hypothetical protein
MVDLAQFLNLAWEARFGKTKGTAAKAVPLLFIGSGGWIRTERMPDFDSSIIV